MTRIYLIRHAEAEGNLYRRGQGQYDALITDRGRRQIAALAERFRDIPVDAVYSSDLYRTRRTASAVYLTHGLPLHTDPGLREVRMGEWENLPWGEIGRFYRQQLEYFNSNDPLWSIPGAETFAELRDRVYGTVRKIAARHDGQTIVITSHGMALRNLTAVLLGLPVEGGNQVPHCDNTGVTLVELDNETGENRILLQNDNSHLQDGLSTFAGQKWWKRGGGFWEDANLWYRPLDMKTEADFYYRCRKEAWVGIHGSLEKFDGEGFVEDASHQAKASPKALWVAMLGDKPAGILQLDVPTAQREKIGYMPFVYLMPEARAQGLGVQLIGQGISVFRPLGCEKLRLRCAPDNAVAQKFYARYGFHKIGEAAGSRVPLDLLEKDIGFETF